MDIFYSACKILEAGPMGSALLNFFTECLVLGLIEAPAPQCELSARAGTGGGE